MLRPFAASSRKGSRPCQLRIARYFFSTPGPTCRTPRSPKRWRSRWELCARAYFVHAGNSVNSLAPAGNSRMRNLKGRPMDEIELLQTFRVDPLGPDLGT